MNELICPSCNKAFKIDESGFADIAKQVRDNQFEEELGIRLALAEKEKATAIKLAEAKLKNSLQIELSEKEKEITALKNRSAADLAEKISSKDQQISNYKSQVDKFETERKLAVAEAISVLNSEKNELKNKLIHKGAEMQLFEKSLNEKHAADLKAKDDVIKHKDEEIAMRKDMKLKLSTKMIGETLENHCESEFNKLRSTGFQNAYFEKDNAFRKISKGSLE